MSEKMKINISATLNNMNLESYLAYCESQGYKVKRTNQEPVSLEALYKAVTGKEYSLNEKNNIK